MKLNGKVAVVTGSSRGLGAYIAKRFANEGAKVAIVAKERIDKANTVVDEIRKTGADAYAFQANVAHASECKTLINEIDSYFGAIDILVNNAGIYLPISIEETTELDWDNQLNTNLKSCFFLTQAVLPNMKKQLSGKIINISSSFGLVGHINSGPYCASKGGLINLTRAISLEVACKGININCLSPGGAETDLNFSRRQDPKFKKTLDDATPSGNYFMGPDGLSGAAVFLASSDSDAVHGANISVDGGWTAGRALNMT